MEITLLVILITLPFIFIGLILLIWNKLKGKYHD